ncbi:MAG: tRNA pseudouridine(55) synthase TruB [Simkaniaceae bacterium]
MISNEGLLLLDKPAEKTSFYLVHLLRRLTKIKKIGHSGTLDPFATGLMIMLIGKSATRMQPHFLNDDKEYEVTIKLGEATDTFDRDGKITHTSETVPTIDAIIEELNKFQGQIAQTPPMFSAKKVQGKKLYELARQGIEIEREAKQVRVKTTLLSYAYPHLNLSIACSKGTYIRSIAHELGLHLKSYGYALNLKRTRSGPYSLKNALSVETISAPNFSFNPHIIPCRSPALLPRSPLSLSP